MTTILDRLHRIGLSDQRARQHLAGGYVRVGRGDGTVIHDPDAQVDDDDPIRFQPETITEHS